MRGVAGTGQKDVESIETHWRRRRKRRRRQPNRWSGRRNGKNATIRIAGAERRQYSRPNRPEAETQSSAEHPFMVDRNLLEPKLVGHRWRVYQQAWREKTIASWPLLHLILLMSFTLAFAAAATTTTTSSGYYSPSRSTTGQEPINNTSQPFLRLNAVHHLDHQPPPKHPGPLSGGTQPRVGVVAAISGHETGTGRGGGTGAKSLATDKLIDEAGKVDNLAATGQRIGMQITSIGAQGKGGGVGLVNPWTNKSPRGPTKRAPSNQVNNLSQLDGHLILDRRRMSLSKQVASTDYPRRRKRQVTTDEDGGTGERSDTSEEHSLRSQVSLGVDRFISRLSLEDMISKSNEPYWRAPNGAPQTEPPTGPTRLMLKDAQAADVEGVTVEEPSFGRVNMLPEPEGDSNSRIDSRLAPFADDSDEQSAPPTVAPFDNLTTIDPETGATIDTITGLSLDPITGTPFARWSTITIAILIGLCVLLTVLGNILVLLSFVYERTIRQPSNYLICSLALSDLFIGIISMPFFAIYVLRGWRWTLGPFWCDIWLATDHTLCLISIYTVLLITVDRFFSIKAPTKYREWRTRRKVIMMVIITWLVPFAIFFGTIMSWDWITGKRDLKEYECAVQFLKNPLFNTSLILFYFFSTLLIMFILYGGIYKTARDLAKKSENKQKRMQLMMSMQQQQAEIIARYIGTGGGPGAGDAIGVAQAGQEALKSSEGNKRKVADGFSARQDSVRHHTASSHQEEETKSHNQRARRDDQNLRANLDHTEADMRLTSLRGDPTLEAGCDRDGRRSMQSGAAGEQYQRNLLAATSVACKTHDPPASGHLASRNGQKSDTEVERGRAGGRRSRDPGDLEASHYDEFDHESGSRSSSPSFESDDDSPIGGPSSAYSSAGQQAGNAGKRGSISLHQQKQSALIGQLRQRYKNNQVDAPGENRMSRIGGQRARGLFSKSTSGGKGPGNNRSRRGHDNNIIATPRERPAPRQQPLIPRSPIISKNEFRDFMLSSNNPAAAASLATPASQLPSESADCKQVEQPQKKLSDEKAIPSNATTQDGTIEGKLSSEPQAGLLDNLKASSSPKQHQSDTTDVPKTSKEPNDPICQKCTCSCGQAPGGAKGSRMSAACKRCDSVYNMSTNNSTSPTRSIISRSSSYSSANTPAESGASTPQSCALMKINETVNSLSSISSYTSQQQSRCDCCSVCSSNTLEGSSRRQSAACRANRLARGRGAKLAAREQFGSFVMARSMSQNMSSDETTAGSGATQTTTTPARRIKSTTLADRTSQHRIRKHASLDPTGVAVSEKTSHRSHRASQDGRLPLTDLNEHEQPSTRIKHCTVESKQLDQITDTGPTVSSSTTSGSNSCPRGQHQNRTSTKSWSGGQQNTDSSQELTRRRSQVAVMYKNSSPVNDLVEKCDTSIGVASLLASASLKTASQAAAAASFTNIKSKLKLNNRAGSQDQSTGQQPLLGVGDSPERSGKMSGQANSIIQAPSSSGHRPSGTGGSWTSPLVRSGGMIGRPRIGQRHKSKSENRARKALRTISFILGAFVVCWTPYHILALVAGFCTKAEGCVNTHLFYFTYFLCYTNSPINPFCYALANAQFKRAFYRVLRCNFGTWQQKSLVR